MNVYSRLNTETKMYHVYIAMVGFNANIPQDVYESCINDNQRLRALIEYSLSSYHIIDQDIIDPDKYIPLELYSGKQLPKTALEYLSYIRGISGNDLKEYKYLTIDYQCKIVIHSECPEWRDDYWYSEGSIAIGYIPNDMSWEDIGNEEYIDYVIDHVFVVKE